MLDFLTCIDGFVIGTDYMGINASFVEVASIVCIYTCKTNPSYKWVMGESVYLCIRFSFYIKL